MNSEAEFRKPPARFTAPLDGIRLAIVSDAAPERNGVGAYYQDLQQQLAPRLAAIEAFSPTIEDGKWNAGIVLPLPGDPTQKLCIPNPWLLQRQLKDFAPHIVVVATPGAYGLAGAFLASRMNVPVLVGFHTSFDHLTELYWRDSWRGKVVHQYFKRCHAYLFHKAEQVLANSSDMREVARKMGRRATTLVGTPISSTFIATPPVQYEGAFNRVLFAGRLAAEKNIDAVLQAVRALPQIQFSIAGDGPLHSQVTTAAAELSNLDYLGWLDRGELRDQVDRHDALVLPSHFESFGTIALEVMARNRLAVISPHCGIAQWPELREGLYVIENQQSLEQTLRRITAESPAARRAKAARALSQALALNERNLNQWCELLVALASK